jgi:rubrerythrin
MTKAQTQGSADSHSPLSEGHPSRGKGVEDAMSALFTWNYEPEIEQLRTLYANGLDRQWVAMRDLDWECDIDREAFTESFTMGGLPIGETDFWKQLPLETRWEVAKVSASFMLSNFLHGEQGALMVAGQLVSVVPHMDGKFYAATQTLDEARHVEAFAAYIEKVGEVHEISPGLRQLLDATLATDDWMKKAVGMQIVTEGLALFFFRSMRNNTEEPLLKKMLTYVARDEARHTGYGIKYLSHVVPTLSEEKKRELEDFAFETTRMLMASRTGAGMQEAMTQAWQRQGFDPSEVMVKLSEERGKVRAALERDGGRYGPVSGFIIPTLRAVGLYSEHTAQNFKQMWVESQGSEAAERYANSRAELPLDLEAWVNEGHELL